MLRTTSTCSAHPTFHWSCDCHPLSFVGWKGGKVSSCTSTIPKSFPTLHFNCSSFHALPPLVVYRVSLNSLQLITESGKEVALGTTGNTNSTRVKGHIVNSREEITRAREFVSGSGSFFFMQYKVGLLGRDGLAMSSRF